MPHCYELAILVSLLFLLGFSAPIASGGPVGRIDVVGQTDVERHEATVAPSTRPLLRDWGRPVIFDTRLPFGPTGFRQDIPSVRYNRVEGVVLGLRLQPIEPGDWRRIKPVGQFGYAFALKKVRFDAGLEARPFARIPKLTGTVVGARYRQNTATEDDWKAPWTENTLAAMLFRNDFFDYYDTQGWSAYIMQPLGRRLQVSAGFVAEKHSELDLATTWSLLGGGTRRPALTIDEGEVRAVRLTADAGRVRELYEHPSGAAIRIEAEIAPSGLGGDMTYSRLVADARYYFRTTRTTHLAMRFRAGLTSDDAPPQKTFSLGGVGSVRGYPINSVWGSRMMLLNAEYAVAEFDFGFEGIQVFGFADAGYADFPRYGDGEDELLLSAGAGISLAGRNLRLELAFPINDIGFSREPALWFRLFPPF